MAEPLLEIKLTFPKLLILFKDIVILFFIANKIRLSFSSFYLGGFINFSIASFLRLITSGFPQPSFKSTLFLFAHSSTKLGVFYLFNFGFTLICFPLTVNYVYYFIASS